MRRSLWVVLAVFLGSCGRPITVRQARERRAPVTREPVARGGQVPAEVAELARAAARYPEPRRQLVEVALAMAGSPAKGLDCSSFVQRVYRTIGHSLPRTVRSQLSKGVPVTTAELQPGDLVFFAFERSPADHVGIYTGSGTFVHVSSAARAVRVEALAKPVFARVHVGNRRFLDAPAVAGGAP